LEPGVRIYLAGRVCIESPQGVVGQAAFPGRQGRLAFAYLVLRHGPVPREELADLLWSGELPPSWDTALSAVISKLRRLLRDAGFDSQALVSALGCYELRLPGGAWVDIDAAAAAIHEAESALRVGDYRTMWGAASVAYHITRRPFLPGDDAPWLDQQRAYIQGLHDRATECFAIASLSNGESSLAAALAEELLAHEPFRESGYQLLMRAHAAAGSRAEALRTYERCRRFLADELGADPSPETQALHLQLLTEGD
jgi:DNA-binding SARP family transcriptional activator